MRAMAVVGVIVVATAAAGCGGSGEPEKQEEPMKVEDTVFAPVVTAPERVQDRTNAAVDLRRDNLDRRLQEDEGAPREEPAED
jgi:hypothetical protein